jgi:signal transduction histidine kinase
VAAPMVGIGDPVRLGRAIDQLLDNAQKFTPVGGSVGIRARPLADRQFELFVADSGPGVPEHAAKRVFEPFFQADGSETRSYGGAGVGLAVVRGVARGHGGYVCTKSPAEKTVGGPVSPNCVPSAKAASLLRLRSRGVEGHVSP